MGEKQAFRMSTVALVTKVVMFQVSQFDLETVQLTALRVTFDLFHLYGMEAFLNVVSNDTARQNESGDDMASDEAMSEIEAMMSEMNTGVVDDASTPSCAQSIIRFLIGLLDSEVNT